jgi:hypothetical protein
MGQSVLLVELELVLGKAFAASDLAVDRLAVDRLR